MKKVITLILQALVLSMFVLSALACGGSNMSAQEAYDTGYQIGEGVGRLIAN